MKTQTAKEKLSSFFKKVGRRNLIIAASFLVVAVALVASIAMFGKDDGGFDYSQGVGMDGGNNSTQQKPSESEKPAEDTYFSSVAVDRERTRDEALEVLQSVVDNKEATETAKAEALAQINAMAKTMEAESNIESLIVAKGFEECVAVISGDNASIVVKSEGLTVAQISQINEIVYEQAKILPVNIKIIER